MKITAIKTANFIGSRNVDIKLDRPITLICGHNHSGKSSLAEAVRMAAFGHVGKAAIHPSQIAAIHRAYTPDQNSVARALRIVKAAKAADESGVGAYTVDGMMVDGPVVDQARNVLNRAKLAGMLEPADLEAL